VIQAFRQSALARLWFKSEDRLALADAAECDREETETIFSARLSPTLVQVQRNGTGSPVELRPQVRREPARAGFPVELNGQLVRSESGGLHLFFSFKKTSPAQGRRLFF